VTSVLLSFWAGAISRALYCGGSSEGMKEEKENDISPVINEGSIEK
jgi:hypothetical protein